MPLPAMKFGRVGRIWICPLRSWRHPLQVSTSHVFGRVHTLAARADTTAGSDAPVVACAGPEPSVDRGPSPAEVHAAPSTKMAAIAAESGRRCMADTQQHGTLNGNLPPPMMCPAGLCRPRALLEGWRARRRGKEAWSNA